MRTINKGKICRFNELFRDKQISLHVKLYSVNKSVIKSKLGVVQAMFMAWNGLFRSQIIHSVVRNWFTFAVNILLEGINAYSQLLVVIALRLYFCTSAKFLAYLIVIVIEVLDITTILLCGRTCYIKYLRMWPHISVSCF